METTWGWCVLFWRNPERRTLQSSIYTATYLPSYEPYKKYEQDMQHTVVEVGKNLWETFTCGFLSMDPRVLADYKKNTIQLYVDTEWCLENLLEAMNNRDGGREKGIHTESTLRWYW